MKKPLSRYHTGQAWADMESASLDLYQNICHRRNLRFAGQTLAKLCRIQRKLVLSNTLRKKAVDNLPISG
jgi:hypothetical protein